MIDMKKISISEKINKIKSQADVLTLIEKKKKIRINNSLSKIIKNSHDAEEFLNSYNSAIKKVKQK